MKTRSRQTRTFAACGFLVFGALAMMPGCGGSMESVVTRYREQNSGARIPDITAERLQGCVEEFGGQLVADTNQILATVQVDPEGRTQGVTVAGVPMKAEEFTACVRVALLDMAVPEIALRQKQATTGQTVSKGNELANPIVLWEIGVVLAELLAAHGGRTVLYTVTVEVVSAAAVGGAVVYLRKRKKKTCTEHLQDCLMTSTADLPGNHPGHSRCVACFDKCSDGIWPTNIDLADGGSCAY